MSMELSQGFVDLDRDELFQVEGGIFGQVLQVIAGIGIVVVGLVKVVGAVVTAKKNPGVGLKGIEWGIGTVITGGFMVMAAFM